MVCIVVLINLRIGKSSFGNSVLIAAIGDSMVGAPVGSPTKSAFRVMRPSDVDLLRNVDCTVASIPRQQTVLSILECPSRSCIQVHDSRTALTMLDGVKGSAIIADKAYDSNAIRATVKAARMKAVIPSNRSRKKIIRHDKALYRERNRIERCFNKLKHFRRLATRYDRRACHFLAFLCLAGA